MPRARPATAPVDMRATRRISQAAVAHRCVRRRHTHALFSSSMSGPLLTGAWCRPNAAPGRPTRPSSPWAGWSRERPQPCSTASCPAPRRWDRERRRVPDMKAWASCMKVLLSVCNNIWLVVRIYKGWDSLYMMHFLHFILMHVSCLFICSAFTSMFNDAFVGELLERDRRF